MEQIAKIKNRLNKVNKIKLLQLGFVIICLIPLLIRIIIDLIENGAKL